MPRRVLPSALLLALILAPLLTTWAPAGHADEPPTVHEVASNLMCQCGCSMTVATCQESMTCSIADGIVEETKAQIAEGKGKGEILDYFVGIYGEGVLAAPRKSGFGLAAWVTPFLVVGAGGVIAAVLIWLWASRRSARSEATAPAASSFYEECVDEDLRLLE